MVESTGLKDFLQLFEPGSPLAIVAVKAPVGFVTGALADTYEVRGLIEDSAVREVEGCPVVGEWVSVVQLRDDPWTVVLWAAENVPPEVQAGLDPFVADVSMTQETEAIFLQIQVPGLVVGEEELTEPASEFCLYEDGEVVERGMLSREGRVLSFESSRRRLMETEGSDLETLDRWVAQLGVYVPPCAPDSEGERVVTVGLDPGRVARADLVDGSLRQPFDEETLDMVLEDAPGLGPGRAFRGGTGEPRGHAGAGGLRAALRE